MTSFLGHVVFCKHRVPWPTITVNFCPGLTVRAPMVNPPPPPDDCPSWRPPLAPSLLVSPPPPPAPQRWTRSLLTVEGTVNVWSLPVYVKVLAPTSNEQEPLSRTSANLSLISFSREAKTTHGSNSNAQNNFIPKINGTPEKWHVLLLTPRVR